MDKSKIPHYIAATAIAGGGLLNIVTALWHKRQWDDLMLTQWLEHEAATFAHDALVRDVYIGKRYEGLAGDEISAKLPQDYEFYRMQRMHELEEMSTATKREQVAHYKARAKEQWGGKK